jgi:hypothetical protein
MLVAFVLGVCAAAASYARAVEEPGERWKLWWLPVAILGAAVVAKLFVVVMSSFEQGGGVLAPPLLRQGIRANAGLVVWPMAMAATLAFLPRRARRLAVPGAALMVLLAGWTGSGGFRDWGRGGDEMMIRGRPQALVERVTPQVAYQKRHLFGRFRPSAVRFAPDGQGHALGAVVTAKRGTIWEWRVFPARSGEPFILEANDIAFIGPERLLALAPATGDFGHTGFELREVSASGTDNVAFRLPLVLRPRLAVDPMAKRWTVNARAQDLIGRVRGRTDTGFVMRLDDGNAVIEISPRTLLKGISSPDELTPNLWVEVDSAGPGFPTNEAASVTALGMSPPDRGGRPSMMYQQAGTYGRSSNIPDTWIGNLSGAESWTPLDDHHALAVVQVEQGGRAFTGEAQTRLEMERSSRPRFELVEMTRSLDPKTLTSFETAVVCKSSVVHQGVALCTASDDRTLSVWLATVGEDGIELDSLVSFTSSFMSPAVVTNSISVLTGPMVDPVVVDHETGRAGALDLPSGLLPISLVPLRDRSFAALVTVDEYHVAVVYAVPRF